MKITIDKGAGFCPGVKGAINKAEKELRQGKGLASYGSLLHNELEMIRLEDCGLTLASEKDIPFLKGKKLMFRTHGEPPSSYEMAEEQGVELIDATCGVVRRLQKQVRAAADEMRIKNGQVVIFGKADHPEVKGLLGQTGDLGLVVRDPADVVSVDPLRPVRLFSQTTMDKKAYEEIAETIEMKMKEHGNADFIRYNSICRHVVNRIPSLKNFAEKHDVVIFVSGRNSSNGQKLFNVSKQLNPRTYFVTGPEELNPEWFESVSRVGVSGAASTPEWLMHDVALKIEGMN